MFLPSEFFYLYGAMIGFAFAGIAACAFEYVTDRRLEFDIAPELGFTEGLSGILIRFVAGPYLVARFLGKLSGDGGSPLLVWSGAVLVVAWSLSMGIIIIASFMN